MLSVGFILGPETVSAVADNRGQHFLLENTVDQLAFSAVDQPGHKLIPAIDIDWNMLAVDPGNDV